MTPRVDWAVRYIEKLGFALVPIPPRTKRPIHTGWNTPSGYFTDPSAARQHWIAHPQDNMGAVLAPSGLCSLDVDHVEHSRSVFAVLGLDLDRYRTDYPGIQGNPARFRLLFRAPAGVVLNRQVLVWPANKGDKPITVFELRAGDIQDVLPPSIHPDTGKPYIWLTPPKGSIPELPAELLELWQSWPSYKKSLEALCPWGVAELPPRPQRGLEGISVIAEFNRQHTVVDLLEQYGYKRMGKRYLAPSSASQLPGVTVKDGACYSHHASDVLNDGHSHDAFDLYRVIEHGGDSKAALRAAAAVLGLEAPKVKGQAEPKGSASEPNADPDQKIIAELAALPPLEYDGRREAVAKDLSVRVATLDKEVTKARGAGGEETAAGASSGKVLSLEDPEPWPEPVNGAALLERLRDTLADHVILPEGGR